MMLIEITHPRGRLRQEDRARIAEHILGVLLLDGHAPEETMRRGREMTHVLFREAEDWHTGSGATPRTAAGQAPPLIATITVPQAWQEEVARHMVATVRAAVRRVDADHGWTRQREHLWVNVVGIPDGGIGLGGKAMTADGVLAHMTEEYRAAQQAGTVEPAPEGKVVDPVCGMFVTLGKNAIILEHRGKTVGFCAQSCRDAYCREHGLPVGSSRSADGSTA